MGHVHILLYAPFSLDLGHMPENEVEKENLEVIFVYESFRFASYLHDSRGVGIGRIY